MRKTIITCDIDNCENTVNVIPHKDFLLPDIKGPGHYSVIFLTEETEGRSVEPHITLKKLDLCSDCMRKLTSGKMIYGRGAQGFNNYFFKDTPFEEQSPTLSKLSAKQLMNKKNK